MATWKYILIGLGIGVLGAILWVVVSVVAAGVEVASGTTPPLLEAFLIIGFFVMVGGPLAFWIILPVRRAIKNRRARTF
jgi:hypothetical protein